VGPNLFRLTGDLFRPEAELGNTIYTFSA